MFVDGDDAALALFNERDGDWRRVGKERRHDITTRGDRIPNSNSGRRVGGRGKVVSCNWVVSENSNKNNAEA